MDRPLPKTIDIFVCGIKVYDPILAKKIIRKTLYSQRARSCPQFPRSTHGTPGTMTPLLVRQVQNAGHRSQVTGHGNFNKKLDTPLVFSCLPICFISGYVTIRHMFGINHAFCFVLRVKELNGKSYTLY